MPYTVEFIVCTCGEKKKKKKLLLPIGLEPAELCSNKSASYGDHTASS
jgi:hypothetical protein